MTRLDTAPHRTDDDINECACLRWECWDRDPAIRAAKFAAHVARQTPPDRTARMLGRLLVAGAALVVFGVVTVLLVVNRAEWDAWAILGVGALVTAFGVWDGRAR